MVVVAARRHPFAAAGGGERPGALGVELSGRTPPGQSRHSAAFGLLWVDRAAIARLTRRPTNVSAGI